MMTFYKIFFTPKCPDRRSKAPEILIKANIENRNTVRYSTNENTISDRGPDTKFNKPK